MPKHQHLIKEISSCSGHCCEKFNLPYSIEELKKMRDEGRMRGSDAQIPEMLIDLGKTKLSPNGQTMEQEHQYYTCKHFTAERRCAIYETRPEMCSSYPEDHRNEGTCNYIGCTRVVEKTCLFPLRYPKKIEELVHDQTSDESTASTEGTDLALE